MAHHPDCKLISFNEIAEKYDIDPPEDPEWGAQAGMMSCVEDCPDLQSAIEYGQRVVAPMVEHDSRKLWHDDIRRPPDGSWIWVRTNREAKHVLGSLDIEEASLDHDLGLHHEDPDQPNAFLMRGSDPENDGYRLVKWMVAQKRVPPKVTVHSYNPDPAMRMVKSLLAVGCEAAYRPYEPPA